MKAARMAVRSSFFLSVGKVLSQASTPVKIAWANVIVALILVFCKLFKVFSYLFFSSANISRVISPAM